MLSSVRCVVWVGKGASDTVLNSIISCTAYVMPWIQTRTATRYGCSHVTSGKPTPWNSWRLKWWRARWTRRRYVSSPGSSTAPIITTMERYDGVLGNGKKRRVCLFICLFVRLCFVCFPKPLATLLVYRRFRGCTKFYRSCRAHNDCFYSRNTLLYTTSYKHRSQTTQSTSLTIPPV